MSKDNCINACEQDIIEVHIPATETIVAIWEDAIGTLDNIVNALNGEIWSDAQAKALGDTANAVVKLAAETIAAVTLSEETFDHGYDEGFEDGYDEALCDLTDDDDDDWDDDDDLEGIPTQFFYCSCCDGITDMVLLSSETGDKLCPDCGSVMDPYFMDDDEDDELQALCCEECNQIINSQDAPDGLCPKCRKPLTVYEPEPRETEE